MRLNVAAYAVALARRGVDGVAVQALEVAGHVPRPLARRSRLLPRTLWIAAPVGAIAALAHG
jgi:hypothetical protein